MNREELHNKFIALEAEVSKKPEYISYKFDSGNNSSLLLVIYLYNDNEASFSLEVKSDPELYTANKSYEKIDFENESELFTHLYSDLSQVLDKGIECYSKNSMFFHYSEVLLMGSKTHLFGSSAFRFSNFKIPKKHGVIGVFQATA